MPVLVVIYMVLPSSASLIVFRFWPKTTKYAYFKEPFLTHLTSLKRIRTFCARNNMTAFLSERYLSYNLSTFSARLGSQTLICSCLLLKQTKSSYSALKNVCLHSTTYLVSPAHVYHVPSLSLSLCRFDSHSNLAIYRRPSYKKRRNGLYFVRKKSE